MSHEDDLTRGNTEEAWRNRIPIDPVRMFLRTLDDYQDLVAKYHDIEIQLSDHKNFIAEKFRDQNDKIDGLVERMDNQVSKTGHRNSDEIKALNTKMEKLDTQLFDKDTGLISQFVISREWQANFNRVVVGAFVTGVLGLVVWLVQHFRN